MEDDLLTEVKNDKEFMMQLTKVANDFNANNVATKAGMATQLFIKNKQNEKIVDNMVLLFSEQGRELDYCVDKLEQIGKYNKEEVAKYMNSKSCNAKSDDYKYAMDKYKKRFNNTKQILSIKK